MIEAHEESKAWIHCLQRVSQEVSDSMFGIKELEKLHARALGIRDNALHLGEDLQMLRTSKGKTTAETPPSSRRGSALRKNGRH